jgi:glycosyltransferase involved in cell wall biosynthesis
MACGTPLTASNVSSIPEVTGSAAILFDPLSIKDMSNAIEKIAIDLPLRKQIIQRGFVQIKKFSWKNSVKELLSAFEEIYNTEKK